MNDIRMAELDVARIVPTRAELNVDTVLHTRDGGLSVDGCCLCLSYIDYLLPSPSRWQDAFSDIHYNRLCDALDARVGIYSRATHARLATDAFNDVANVKVAL